MDHGASDGPSGARPGQLRMGTQSPRNKGVMVQINEKMEAASAAS